MDSEDESSAAPEEKGNAKSSSSSPVKAVPLDKAETLSQMAILAPKLEKRLIAGEVRSRELCEVAAALARTKYFDAGLFEQLSRRLQSSFKRQSLKMGEILGALSSLAELNAYNAELFEAGCKAIQEDLPRAQETDRQRLEAALKRVGHTPSEEFASALRRRRGGDTREACAMFFRGQCKWGPKCKLSHDPTSFDDTAKEGVWKPPSVSGGKSVGFNQSSDLFKADRCGALW